MCTNHFLSVFFILPTTPFDHVMLAFVAVRRGGTARAHARLLGRADVKRQCRVRTRAARASHAPVTLAMQTLVRIRLAMGTRARGGAAHR